MCIEIVGGAEAGDSVMGGGEVTVPADDMGYGRQQVFGEMGDLTADRFEPEPLKGRELECIVCIRKNQNVRLSKGDAPVSPYDPAICGLLDLEGFLMKTALNP
jgi:hypothetical protein